MAADTPSESLPQQPEEPLAYRVVRGGMWLTAGSYFNLLIGFLAGVFLTRILAPEDFGVFALASFFFSLINLRPKLGIGYAFAQRPDTTSGLLGTFLTLSVTSSVLTLLIALALAPVLPAFGYTSQVIWIILALSGVGVVDSVSDVYSGMLGKELHLARASLLFALAFPLSYIPGFWLALHGGGYWAILAQNAMNSLLLFVGLWWSARRRLPHHWLTSWHFDRTLAVGLVRFGVAVGAATLLGGIVLQFDNFLVGTFVNVETLGFYDRAYRTAQWPATLVMSLVSVAGFYTYARLQSDPVRLKKTVTMTYWLITTVAAPIGLAIFVSAPDLIRFLYLDRWLPSAPFLRFLVIYSLLRPLLDNATSLFVAVGKPQRTTILTAVHAIMLVATATPLTLAFGAIGTCVGVGISFVVALGLAWYFVRQTVDLSFRDTWFVPFAASILTIVAYVVLSRLFDLGQLSAAAGSVLGPGLLSALPTLGSAINVELGLRVLIEAGFAALMFWVFSLIIAPRQTLDRVTYVWQLARHNRQAAA